jgi:hypothetical protein
MEMLTSKEMFQLGALVIIVALIFIAAIFHGRDGQ